MKPIKLFGKLLPPSMRMTSGLNCTSRKAREGVKYHGEDLPAESTITETLCKTSTDNPCS
jgi:hypothetical protein